MISIIQPTLLLDEAKCRQNIIKMTEKARRNNVRLRPHFKTHQSATIGKWFAESGVTAITVSSVRMACYFAEAGWNDITIAFPVNIHEAERINRLAKRISLNLLVEDPATVTMLNEQLEYAVNVYIKVDLGARRTGINPSDNQAADDIIRAIEKSDQLDFKGFLGHAGQSYNCRSYEEIKLVHDHSLGIMQKLYDTYSSTYPDLEISVGDTPTCSVCENFSPATEIRPGNFVFFDLTQSLITSCRKEQIAVALACPVVAKHHDRNEIILYGGGVHFSKEYIARENGERSFGEMVTANETGWGDVIESCFISKLSQEHGTLKVSDEVFRTIQPGDVVRIFPVHSCMTADLMGSFTTTEGTLIECMDKRKEYLAG